ncbi:flagella basal body P-ring formation protein FlgA [Brevundimonas sp. AJA228-03]|uniref:flagella basal body P-ring formation protein FlgA n=1 Tax=Brevundimonas sp. AJA228-03 TaxID=2752515 RepID=UPI001AE0B614|nr:flagella basal body P-ring formation protein FlgA [Brevundimonas sp. AJA228-03]QTN20538.1 flagella basal body P-ring formation protein FlgA [Brevundimonas sp. AJA228-03]
MRALSLIAALGLLASPAFAGPVTLKANPVDDDGRVTLGDVFDGAGPAANFVLASRAGPSVVFEASQLQAIASRNGLQWANPNGLRRVVVRQASLAPATGGNAVTTATAGSAALTQPAPTVVAPLQRQARAARVIARNDMIEVAYAVGGVTLTVTGRATRDAAAGENVPILNVASGRTIDAVAIGPGRAITGPEAQAVRAQLPFASR